MLEKFLKINLKILMIIFAKITLCYSVFISALVFVYHKKQKGVLFEKGALQDKFDKMNLANASLTTSEQSNKQIREELKNKIITLDAEIKTLNESNSKLASREAEIKTEKKSLEEKITEQKTFIEEAQKNLKTEFENIASKHLKTNSSEFLKNSSSELTNILKPYKEGLEALKTKVDDTYKAESAERNSLKGHIELLVSQSAKVGSTAENLTKALKGDRKMQGNWGEKILEQLLETSGLQKHIHYEIQPSFIADDGGRQMPDVTIKLSEGKEIVIDSKVSLVAYERYFNEDYENQKNHSTDFITSVKKHIDDLEKRNYQGNQNINSLNFVIMFMPIEGTYQLAYQLDKEIFSYGWNKRVILTSPSTLFPLLKSIAWVWKIDAQNKNQKEIIRLATNLYEKFISFGNSLENVGSSIDKSRKSYEQAISQLRDGSGSAVSLVKRLESYGIEKKPSKNKEMPAFMEELGDEITEESLEISENLSQIIEE